MGCGTRWIRTRQRDRTSLGKASTCQVTAPSLHAHRDMGFERVKAPSRQGQATWSAFFVGVVSRRIDARPANTCHSREGGNPSTWQEWMPACAGITVWMGADMPACGRYLHTAVASGRWRNENWSKRSRPCTINDSYETYGSPRVYRELKAQDVACSENRVARLMKI